MVCRNLALSRICQQQLWPVQTFLLACSGADIKSLETQVTHAHTHTHTWLAVALGLISKLQPSADSSTYLTLPPSVIPWCDCESLNTSCCGAEPGHPMAWWSTSLTSVTRGRSGISSVCLCVTCLFALVCGLKYTNKVKLTLMLVS